MTNEQAIIILDALGLTVGMFIQNPEEYKTAIGMGMVALEKQTEAEEYRTPKKPTQKRIHGTSLFDEAICPICGNTVYSTEDACSKCGQLLDWTEAGQEV